MSLSLLVVVVRRRHCRFYSCSHFHYDRYRGHLAILFPPFALYLAYIEHRCFELV